MTKRLRPMSIRPAVRADLEAVLCEGQPLGPSARAVVGEVDGEVVGVGGLAFAAGRVVLFLDIKPACRRYKLRMHKEALRMLESARGRHPLIYAFADEEEPGAARWLTRLGFTHHEGNLYRQWLN